MPLVGSNHRSIRIHCEALLTRDYRLKIRSSKRLAVTSEGLEKMVYRDPTSLVECDSDYSWLVA